MPGSNGERFPHAPVAVGSSVSQPFYTSSKSEHSSEFLGPPLQTKVGKDSAPAGETREQGRKSWADSTSLCGAAFLFRKVS